MNEDELSAIASHLDLVAGVEFVADRPGLDSGQVGVRTAGGEVVMDVRRGFQNASPGDTDFIVNSLADLCCLLSAVRSGQAPSSALRREMVSRVSGASPAPWLAAIESDGGLPGCDVILVGGDRDDEEDMYLWIDGDLAPGSMVTWLPPTTSASLPTLARTSRDCWRCLIETAQGQGAIPGPMQLGRHSQG